ncbi:MAG TPA: hypothetical protein VFD70_19655 [Anaerolineae bacterium]|nr:hypothetical protein [Anaerolineae bacterium]
MDIEHLCWLREIVVTDVKGQERVQMEFSYDNGIHRAPHFFPVPPQDLTEARALYQAWGGIRAPGYRRGTTAKGPSKPFAPSIQLWRENGH